jgi:hypothetical protein
MAPHARVGQPRRAAPLYYGRAGTNRSILRYARSEVVVADAANMVQDDGKSMSQHRERDRYRPLNSSRL